MIALSPDSPVARSAQQAHTDSGTTSTKADRLAEVRPAPEVRLVVASPRRHRATGAAGHPPQSHADADVLAVAPVPLPGDANGGEACDASGLLHAKKLTVPQAAKLLGVGQTTLRAMIANGEIPVMRIGNNKILLLERDLEDYLSGRHGPLKKVADDALPKLAPLPAFVRESTLFAKLGREG